MKRKFTIVLLTILLGFFANLNAQIITLDECYSLAQQNYPQIKQMELINQSTAFSVDNVNKGYLPQLSINGQATYQSDVTRIPISIPGISIEPPKKDQYKVYAEVNQPLTDLLTVKKNKALAEASGELDEQKVQIDLYQVKERINQLYFGILLVDAQMDLTSLMIKEIDSSLVKLNSAVKNGVAIQSNAILLEIEMIKADQKMIELKSSRKAYIKMLGQFIGQDLKVDISLSIPMSVQNNFELKRPELVFFESQKSLLDLQSDLISSKNIPHLGFFFQGGYGRPALNMLSTEFKTYYITGLRLNWNLSGLYTMKKEKKIISIRKSMSDIQKETFEFNTNMILEQQSNELEKISQLLEKDQAIITLHEQVIKSAKSQLENGTITTFDFISNLNALDQARLSQSNHEIQLLMAQQKIQFTSGN